MSLVALAGRQPEAAVRMASAGVAVSPAMGAAWVALGQALKAAGQIDAAESAYRHALRLSGTDPLARLGLGELKLAALDPESAFREFQLALRRRPTLAVAHLGMGNAIALLGRPAEALPHYHRALDLRPRFPEAEFATGFALARLGRVDEAEKRYRRAIALRPDFAAAWMNLGSLLREQGQDLYAEAALRRAAQLRPDLVAAWINLAVFERQRKRPDKAEKYLRRAFALNPAQVETHIAWCQFRLAQRDLPGAWAWLRWALARDPDRDESVNMRGILLHNERRFAEAVEEFERAEVLGSLAAASNRGNSLLEMDRPAAALAAHQRAVELDPGNAGAQYNLALTRLRFGDWQRGWPGYEARWRFREVHRAPRRFLVPRWRGEPLNGRRVLLHAEQGLGDTIQFCRYASLVAARGGLPVLQVQPPVERLMQSLAVVHAGLAATALLGDRSTLFDLECPLMSLPAVFRTTPDTVPWADAYLGAQPDEVRGIWAAFPSTVAGPRVGLSWAGNPSYKADAQRSTRLSTFLPLLRSARANWISLQKGEPAQQLASLPPAVHVIDGSSADRDLAQTAALVATLDLVITTDTCIAHLAGAMGKPVWILLPHLADWRWMQQTVTTPWYPTARLFRQSAAGDWPGLIERVCAEFSKYAFPACLSNKNLSHLHS